MIASRSGDDDAGESQVEPIFRGQVFSTTRAKDREAMGDVITQWLRNHPGYEVVDTVVMQSSDREFHCLSITLFYRERRRRS